LSEVEIILENIGGLLGEHSFTLKKGLNIVKAPNAEGKTSFINGLMASVLPEESLKQKRHFLNYIEGNGKITIHMNGKKWERRLDATNGTLYASGTPISTDGEKAAFFAFAVPDNELFDLIRRGETLEKRFETLSDAKYYNLAANWFNVKRQDVVSQLSLHRSDEELLSRMEQQIQQLDKEIADLRNEKARLPQIDISKLTDVIELRKEIDGIIREASTLRAQSDNAKIQIRNMEGELKQKLREKEYFSEKIRSFYEKHPEFDEEIEKITGEIDNLYDKEKTLSNSLGRVEFSLIEIEKQIEKAVKFGVEECFVCGHKLTIKQAEERRARLSDERAQLGKSIRQIDVKINDLKEERTRLEEERLRIKSEYEINLRNAESRERFLTSEINKNKRTLETSESRIKKLDEKLEKLRKSFDAKALEIYTRGIEIEEAIKVRRTQIESLNKQVAQLGKIRKIIDDLRVQENFLKFLEGYFSKRASEIRDVARINFNKRIIEVYNDLDFKDFRKIEINPRYIIDVEREKEGRPFKQPIYSLSASERLTIGVVTMLAGKDEYLKDFPFFILDELITSYDPTRFKSIIQYLQKDVEYVVVTALAPSGELEIKHKLDEKT
jgi:DNA repair exonuclease SbcCD ATPase subunit